ncbi:hypothetical protein DNTS_014720 [Danionella cerebrum]|uniref:T-box domain-containing protein n=1 Tax=Danionella cerebrum TaxID=2873325 RepID=A0A553PMR2_9TELE|nr:hypothetical protein DNTS_014720 [Danionella translucida]
MEGISARTHAVCVNASGNKKIKVEKHKNEQMDVDNDSPPGSLFDAKDHRKCRRKTSVEDGKPGESEAVKDVRVDLQGAELWRRFHQIGTEMIITKVGRRMFPSVQVKVHDLEPLKKYTIAMDITPLDSKRYRYVYHSSQWVIAGHTDHSCHPPHLYIHPDSPSLGENWMRQVISFDRVKLTNNETDERGHIILKSMHKYTPRVHVILHSPVQCPSQTLPSLPADGVHTFSFPETQFTTVTAYQNQQITKLKIDRNPFAKGFRERMGSTVAGRYLKSCSSFGTSSSLSPFLPVSSTQAHILKPFLTPHCCKIFSTDSFLTCKACCSICKLSTSPELESMVHFPLMAALHFKNEDGSKSRWFQTSISSGSASGGFKDQNEHLASAFVPPFSYSFPTSPRFTSVSHHLKLDNDESPGYHIPIVSVPDTSPV